MSNNQERDELICSLYKEGHTQADLATRFEVTEAWIGQILKKSGLTREDRPTPLKRTKFTGIHLSESVKEALRAEAKREGISMSAFISRLVSEELKGRGIDCEVTFVDDNALLPLEG